MKAIPEHDSQLDQQDDWTPAKGIVRGLIAGVVCATVLAAILAPVAWYFPSVTTDMLLRAAFAFGVAWILFGAVHRAAGMVGWPCTWMVVVLTLLVMLSNHVVFAVHGVPLRDGTLQIGGMWFHPLILLTMNLGTLIGLGFCAWLR